MNGLVKLIVARLLRGRWGAVLPAIFKAAAEGDFGPKVQRVYWATAKYKTFTGMVLMGVGAALETVCGGYPQWAWTCEGASWVYVVGGVLTAVGLVDGGVRAPWPVGTPITDKGIEGEEVLPK